MKRTALLLLTAIYFISCMGMSIDRFYCCGKLTSTTVTYGESEGGVKQLAKNYKCCHHQKQNLKVKDSHFSAASLSISHPLPTIIAAFLSPRNNAVASLFDTQIVYNGNAPPGHPDIPVYTLNCTYRI